MLDFWFNLPTLALFAVLAVTYALIGTIIHLVTFRSPLRAASSSLTGVAPQIFAMVGLMFGLLTGFLAADIADRNRQAARAVAAEAHALADIRTLSIASVSDMTSIRAALQEYLRSVIQDEWTRMSEFGRHAQTDAAYVHLLREVADPKISEQSGSVVHAALLRAVSEVGRERSQRIAISTDPSNTIKWTTVLVLGVITLTAIGLVHVERPRAQITAMSLFIAAMVVALGLMAMQEWPFTGSLQVKPVPLQELFSIMMQSSPR
ncbi:MAG TPA: hypothetical protein VM867_02480 [Xanthobacteraceae bacterium]|nr:hypothetical protein [Xanthobacteraceae bacterium]